MVHACPTTHLEETLAGLDVGHGDGILLLDTRNSALDPGA